MKTETYSHQGAKLKIKPYLAVGIESMLGSLTFKIYKGCSRKLRTAVRERLTLQGWSGEIRINAETKLSITSINDSHALCLQTGNMSRFYADLLKLQSLHQNGKIKAAFYIIPSVAAATKMGSNIAHYSRFIQELEVFKAVITVPILVIGFN